MLIVDDEPAIGTMMVRVLGRHHEVKVVHSGREALELLCGDSGYDRVFCDLMMGDMTGMDLHAALARRRPEYLPRVIFMTGGAFTDRARAFLAEPRWRASTSPSRPAPCASAWSGPCRASGSNTHARSWNCPRS
ncbi:response regulator [Cystobacter fuscus]